MINAAKTSKSVLVIILTQSEYLVIMRLNTETSKNPMIKLNMSTFNSLKRRLLTEYIPGSSLEENIPDFILITRKKKSISTHHIAIVKVIFNSRLLTAELRGNMRVDRCISVKYAQPNDTNRLSFHHIRCHN